MSRIAAGLHDVWTQIQQLAMTAEVVAEHAKGNHPEVSQLEAASIRMLRGRLEQITAEVRALEDVCLGTGITPSRPGWTAAENGTADDGQKRQFRVNGIQHFHIDGQLCGQVWRRDAEHWDYIVWWTDPETGETTGTDSQNNPAGTRTEAQIAVELWLHLHGAPVHDPRMG